MNRLGIIGFKMGMTRIVSGNNLIPVTILNVRNNFISQIKTRKKDGYDSCQLVFLKKKISNISKPLSGHLSKLNFSDNFSVSFKEIRNMKNVDFFVGSEINSSSFNEGETVKIRSKSKGKGNAGVIKRWGFKIGNMSHGGGYPHRLIGSMGGGRGTNQGVPKGKKMPGRMGNDNVTVNSRIEKIDIENNLIFVKGSIPGPKWSVFKLIKFSGGK